MLFLPISMPIGYWLFKLSIVASGHCDGYRLIQK
jgi:hypothetical protein